jgi:hypothetical protein
MTATFTITDAKKEDKFSVGELTRRGVMCRGFGLLPKAPMLDATLKKGAKAVFMTFCAFADNETHETYIGKERVMYHLKISEKTFYKHRKFLENCGYISVRRVRGRIITTITADFSKFGILPRSVILDPRLSKTAKVEYGYFAVFAGKEAGFDGLVARPKRKDMLHHLNISKSTYYKGYRALRAYNYITPRRPMNTRRDRFAYYVLNKNPDPRKALQKCEVWYVGEVRAFKLGTRTKKSSNVAVITKSAKFSPQSAPKAKISIAQTLRNGGISLEVRVNRSLADDFVRYMTNYEQRVKFGDIDFQVYVDALTDLICAGLKSKRVNVGYASIIERLNRDFIYPDGRLDSDLEDMVLEKYRKYAYDNYGFRLENPKEYMKTVIYDAMTSGAIALRKA